jgi:cysteinyl-tRNA synthetase
MEMLQKYFKTYIEDLLALSGDVEQEDGKLEGVIGLLIEIRKEAKARKDYATSDKIRQQLQSLGILLKDEKDGGVSYSFA